MDVAEVLVGITEVAIALAGFSGVVVAFGSRGEGAWLPGDRLRLGFLLEASLTAAGFSLVALLLISAELNAALCWMIGSAAWASYMIFSLVTSRLALRENQDTHGDVDRNSNRVIAALFILLILLQAGNVFVWQQFWPFLAGLIVNLAGAAMQFGRLIRSAFHV
ncbi:MAG: hypothetical protein AAF541_23630 [Pseudomonadota bacterium]